ncbi:MAG: sensor histidine kinase [Acutalibacteraceae bacterium]
MKKKKKNKRISLHQRFSLYNIMAAIVPVFLAICITFIFMVSLIHIIYQSDNNGNPAVTNSRDIITVYFCQFNMRTIERGFENGEGEKTPRHVEKAYKRLESYGFSVCVKLEGKIMYISEGSDEEYFKDLNTDTYQYKGGLVFLDNNTMQIRDVSTNSLGQIISITLKSTGKPTEKRTSVALTLWQLSDISFLGVFIIVVILAVMFDIFIARSLAESVMAPMEKLSKAAERIKLGSLDEPVEIDDSTQEFGDLCRDFEEMRVQLKKSVEAKEEYEKVRRNTYSGLNHDIRTAVTTIKGYTQGLKDGIANTPEKRKRYINAIALSTESLEKLVDALSEITNLETNTVSFHFKERDMYAVLVKWYEESYPSFEARNIGFSMTYNCDKRVFCNIDTFQFERIVDNILTNCVKYKKPESDHIDVSVTASLSDDGMYQLVYADNGIGISPEEAERVFDVFFRADEARTNVQSGNGMGLSIVKQIILRHGGTITAGGEKGKGLTLTMKLPVSRMEDL